MKRSLTAIALAVAPILATQCWLPPARAAIAEPSKPAVVRGNTWFLRDTLTSGTADATFTYGKAGDIPLMGDWDDNGTWTPGVVRGNVWYLRNSNSSGFADVVFTFGTLGPWAPHDFPIAGDWDGTNGHTAGFVRVRSGCGPFDCVIGPNSWLLRNENTSGVHEESWLGGDFESSWVVGDFDGDGASDPGWMGHYKSPGNDWHIDAPPGDQYEFSFDFGRAGDITIAGDWDGDAIDGVGVIRGNTWYLRNSLTSGTAETSFSYGRAGDTFLVWK